MSGLRADEEKGETEKGCRSQKKGGGERLRSALNLQNSNVIIKLRGRNG